MNIAVSYHETLTKLQGLDWPAQGPFDRLDWFALLDDPLYALAESGRGRVLLPLQREEHQLASLANWFSFTWRPLGDDPALLAALARDLRRQTHRVELAPLPDEDGSATALEIAFRDAGWLVAREVCDENHVLPVAGRSFAEYWATRPGKMRTTLKRKARKVEITILTHFDEAAWAEYRAVYESSWKPQEERADLLEADIIACASAHTPRVVEHRDLCLGEASADAVDKAESEC